DGAGVAALHNAVRTDDGRSFAGLRAFAQELGFQLLYDAGDLKLGCRPLTVARLQLLWETRVWPQGRVVGRDELVSSTTAQLAVAQFLPAATYRCRLYLERRRPYRQMTAPAGFPANTASASAGRPAAVAPSSSG